MRIVEFSNGTLRFLDAVPPAAPDSGFVWIYLDRDKLDAHLSTLQHAAQALGGSQLLELHVKDLANRSHPSHYDYTSVYDVITFRRLATDAEVREELGENREPDAALNAFARLRTRAVGFVAFERLLISVHSSECYTAREFVQRYAGDAVLSEGLQAQARNRLPTSPADLMLRMLNLMVDSYLDLRKVLNTELDEWQHQLLSPRTRDADWGALLTARKALHMLQDLCDEQLDAVQEWLDSQMEQPSPSLHGTERDSLLARARDVVEHIERVVHHVHRMEQAAETAVQIHFSALSHRTNEIMRVLTALTAVFLPLNFMTGFFGMNFEYLPLIHSDHAMWLVLAAMIGVALAVFGVFWRKRYLGRTAR